MWSITLLFTAFLLPSAVVDQDAVPGSGARWLDRAVAAYDDLRLDDARIALDRALRDPSNHKNQLIEIYRLKGLVEGSMGQPIAAKRAFSQMLVLQPEEQLPQDYSPKILKAFDAARASLPGEMGITIESAAPPEVLMAHPAALPIRVNDTLGMVEQIVVRYRVASGGEKQVSLTRADRGVLTIPADELPERSQPYTVTLSAVAQNAFGATLAEMEAQETEIRVVGELTDDTLWYQQWWVWASVAGGVAVLAASGITIALIVAPKDTSPRDVWVEVE